MKKSKVIGMVISHLLIYISVSTAQKTDSTIKTQIKTLQLNSSPAYSILGVEPETIQRPNSPADFVANVQSATVNGKLQPNFAMETSPFYWSKTKGDTIKGRFDVIDFITNNNYWKNVARSITFSFATSPSDTFTFGKIPQGTGLAFGMHMQLLQGKLSEKSFTNLLAWFYNGRAGVVYDAIIDKLEGSNDATIDDLDDWLETRFRETNGSFKNIPPVEWENLKRIIKNRIHKTVLHVSDLPALRTDRAKLKKKAESNIKTLNSYQFPLTREGFMLEFAVANARIAENSKWNQLTNAKTSIWITPSFRFNTSNDPSVIDFVDLMAVMRMTFNSRLVDVSDYFDLGGKLQWIHERLSISAEGIARWLTNKPETMTKGYTFKTGVTFSYKLNEMVTFKTTFGSNFDGNSTQYTKPSDLFVVGGFNFGFSSFLPQVKK